MPGTWGRPPPRPPQPREAALTQSAPFPEETSRPVELVQLETVVLRPSRPQVGRGAHGPRENTSLHGSVWHAPPHTRHTWTHTLLPPATARRRNLNPAAGRPSWGGPPQPLRMACPLPGSGRRGLWPCPPAAHRGRRDERRRRVTPSAPAAGGGAAASHGVDFFLVSFLKVSFPPNPIQFRPI